ncbi:MAG TPA: hypothetical protein GX506_05945 [Firmicutes bacterium]|nr:hypothetical protein [Bacillota bacterium]
MRVRYVFKLAVLAAIAVGAFASSMVPVVSAAEPPKVRERVYGLQLWDGKTYQSTFCPGSINEVYMLSGVDNIVTPLVTDVYYWPITQEYMGDWFGYRKELKGTLEIWQGSKKVASLSPVKYVLVYPQGPYSDEVELEVGYMAEQKYKEYKNMVDKYYKEVFEYYSAQSEYEKKLSEFLKDPKKFGKPPVAPAQPIPPREYVTEPQEAMIVNLPPGRYEMQFIEHLESAAGSKPGEAKDGKEPEPRGSLSKKLIVFSPRRRGIGYEIIPEEKWTMPSNSDEPRETLYMEGKRVIFLKAFDESEYNSKGYRRLRELQKPFAGRGLENQYEWIHHTDRTSDVELQIVEGGRVLKTVKPKPYRVVQTPGYSLGYKIVEYDPEKDKGREPSFEAFKVEVDARSGMEIRLVDKQGKIIPESIRMIRVVNRAGSVFAFLVGAVPLLFGIAVVVTRRRTGRKARSSNRGQASVA